MTTPKKGKFNTKILTAILITIIVISISAVAAEYMLAKPAQNNTLPTMTLTVVGGDGTTKTLTSIEISALEAYAAQGASRSGGQIKAAGTYTGIAVSDLIALVGGMQDGQTLTTTAQDGYTTTYNYKQVVLGQDFTTYDSSGNVAVATRPLKLTVIYYFEGAALASGDGPLMMGVLGAEGLATAGNVWEKMVVKLTVNPVATPTPTAVPTVQPTAQPTASPTPPPIGEVIPLAIPDTHVTIIGADNTTVTLSAANLAAYPQTSGLGGKYKSANGIFDYGTYAGVSMTTLLNQVGGISGGQVLSVKAADGYVKNYTYAEVTGTGLTMYNPATVAPATPTAPVTMILAYHLNSTSTNLAGYSDGSYLTVSFVGQDGYATIANMFARYVTEIRVYNQ
jgi:hypothetical protein